MSSFHFFFFWSWYTPSKMVWSWGWLQCHGYWPPWAKSWRLV